MVTFIVFFEQITGKVRREQELHMQQSKEELQQGFIEVARTHLNELKEKMRDELELSSFNKKKTPTAVFNYLILIVKKHLDFVPQQPALYAILTQLRDDELLRCLFNVSIYLGTIDKPEVFIAELKKLYDHQDTMTMQQPPILSGKMSKKDQKKMNAMLQQRKLQLQSPNLDEQNVSSAILILYPSFLYSRQVEYIRKTLR